MLSNKDLAVLTTKLQVPVIVTDILDGEGELTSDVQYGLHEVISEYQPDTALLSIALSAWRVASIYAEASPSMKVLSIEAERIIDEYGDIWLKNARNQSIDSDAVFDVLVNTAEDLESLAELLELNGTFLRAKDEQAAGICDILYIQASAHAMIADEFLRVADEAAEAAVTNIPEIVAPVMTDNVIPFPGKPGQRV